MHEPASRPTVAPRPTAVALPGSGWLAAPSQDGAAAGRCPATLLRLQRLAGNRAVAARLAPAGQGIAVQRQVLAKLDLAEFAPGYYQVWDVIIGGRTPSPFPGTMGAHSTAWVAHIDEVRRTLVNRPLPAAAAALIALVGVHLAEGQALVRVAGSELDGAHLVKVSAAETLLTEARNACARLVPADGVLLGPAPMALQRSVQTLIDRLLTYLNYLPAATVRGGDPRGHGEGGARGDLNQFEYVAALTRRQGGPATAITAEEPGLLRRQLPSLGKGTFATRVKAAQATSFDPASNADLVADVSTLIWTLFAVDTPDAYAAGAKGADLTQVWLRLVRIFVDTIRRAYPYAFGFTAMHLAANQVAGLRLAAARAGVRLPGNFDTHIAAALVDGAHATVRPTDEHPAVAGSDMAGAGSAFQVTVLADDAGVVGDVNMIGRTLSPHSGTMGAHTTAWIAHLDAVRRLVIGNSLRKAWTNVAGHATSALKDPTLDLAEAVEEKQQFYLVQAYDSLRAMVSREPGPHARPHELTAALERIIFQYLTYLNLLPLATIATGYLPDGRAEGRHRTLLVRYEQEGPAALPPHSDRPAVLREALMGLFDPAALTHFPPARVAPDPPDWGQIGFSSRHPLFAQITSAPRGIDVRALARTRFFSTLLEAYPRSMADSGLAGAADVQQLIGDPRTDILATERDELADMLVNNCLIQAVAQAAGINLTLDQLVSIRMRIGTIGNMLLANPRTIGIICQVLGIARGVVVVYPHPAPAEDFGNTDHDPVIVMHTGADHFVPYHTRVPPSPGPAVRSPLKRPGSDQASDRTKRQDTVRSHES
jgi:hypothetical protein